MEESCWMSVSTGLAVFPAKPSGVSPTLSGMNGHMTSSLSACVGGQPNRFLSTAKNPSTAAAPKYGNEVREKERGKENGNGNGKVGKRNEKEKK